MGGENLNAWADSGLVAPGKMGAPSPKSCSVQCAAALPEERRDAVFDELLISLLCLQAEALTRYFVFLAPNHFLWENAPEMQTERDEHL